jgi:hypothetical protein
LTIFTDAIAGVDAQHHPIQMGGMKPQPSIRHNAPSVYGRDHSIDHRESEGLPQITIYDWEIHKGHLEVFDKYVIRYIFYISVFIPLK